MNSCHMKKHKVNCFEFPIVKTNQIVQHKDGEGQPLKTRIDFKKPAKKLRDDKKRNKKEKKKANERKKSKGKKIHKKV